MPRFPHGFVRAAVALQAGKGEGGAGAGLWEELLPGREAWLERGPCMGRGRLPAVLSDERLASALLWRTETAEMEKVRCAIDVIHGVVMYMMGVLEADGGGLRALDSGDH